MPDPSSQARRGQRAPTTDDTANDPALPGLYAHIPFCERLCPYCDFYSEKGYDPPRGFFPALAEEILTHKRLSAFEGPFGSVYVGGGSPSLLPVEDILSLGDAIKKAGIAPGAEFSVEANPGDLDLEKLECWANIGANRLSLGAQSFSATGLAALGRSHSPDDTKATARLAQGLGMRLGLDIIIGWPGERRRDMLRDLGTAVGLGAGHLSVYILTIPGGSRMEGVLEAGGLPPLPSERAVAGMFLLAGEFLEAEGFHRYEVSNFARPGEECRHNRLYWDRLPYLGVGPSAHSFDGACRWANAPELGEWLKAVPRGFARAFFKERLDEEAARLEALLLGLRTDRGIDPSLVRDSAKAEGFVRKGLLTRGKDRLFATERGFLCADWLAWQLA
ncbi:MAG: coproporphyrinogen III oxidase family protein [Deltaproteobacteria bacterium]|jgi:oxygen-independent coproporphyrinogen-3 oxidase|nr:coproporphyrinogen III oxidase family protein [Deltaproteobacteria bacterium]